MAKKKQPQEKKVTLSVHVRQVIEYNQYIEVTEAEAEALLAKNGDHIYDTDEYDSEGGIAYRALDGALDRMNIFCSDGEYDILDISRC